MLEFERIIPAKKLLERWPGCLEEELISLAHPSNMGTDFETLRGYLHVKTLNIPSRGKIHFCDSGIVNPLVEDEYGLSQVKWGEGFGALGIVFNMDDVEAVESNHPEYLCQRVALSELADEFDKDSTASEGPDDGFWVGCDSLSSRWKCSPFDVVDTINNYSLRIDAHYGNSFFQVDTLNDYSIHGVDLARFERDHAEYLQSIMAPELATSPEMRKNEKVDGESGMLTNAEVPLQFSPPEPINDNAMAKTAAASEARDRTTAKRWAEHLEVAVKMACEIVAGKEKEYTKRDLVELAKKHGGDWGEESRQMKALRAALPAKYIHGAGAPQSSSE